jgi:hypothetical protein
VNPDRRMATPAWFESSASKKKKHEFRNPSVTFQAINRE